MDGWKLAQFTIAGIFTIATIGIVAKDGTQIGAFMTATSSAFGSFATAVGNLGGNGA